MGADEESYKIVRFWLDPDKGRETIQTGLTLDEAQEHCQRGDTKEEGVWFDGYESE